MIEMIVKINENSKIISIILFALFSCRKVVATVCYTICGNAIEIPIIHKCQGHWLVQIIVSIARLLMNSE